MTDSLLATAQRLLDLLDEHGALLAEFDFFEEQQVLRVCWHGHLTAAAVVRGTVAGISLRRDGAAPRYILSDESRTTGDWSEALPWMQYEWLPVAASHGLRAIAYVLSADPASQPGSHMFAAAVRQTMPLRTFHRAAEAWQWLIQQDYD